MRGARLLVAVIAAAVVLFGLANRATGDSWAGAFGFAAIAVGAGITGSVIYYAWRRLHRSS
jgi:hypothetical protein